MDPKGRELDPTAYIFLRRVNMLRRMYVKHPEIALGIQDILREYTVRGFPGTMPDDKNINNIQPAPQFGSSLRSVWKEGIKPLGPIGLLCYSAAHYGVVIDDLFICHQKNEVPFSINECPYQ